MKNSFIRKKLLTERKNKYKCIGYARAINNDVKYLNEQIECLKDFGCSIIFSEILSLNQNHRPQFNKALNLLSKGDQIVLTQLDRAFKSQSECLTTINKLLREGIYLRTVSGSFSSSDSEGIFSAVFEILYELNTLEKDTFLESKNELAKNKVFIRKNVGGRPKIDSLKESLVLRLRKDGFSYRSIRSQTGIALSTIRRILLDASI